MQETKTQEIDLGTCLGRRQAFALVAGRCSAADAECLRTIREKKLYRALKVTWQEFCRKQAGVSRSTADQLIRYLEEFGPTYFHLAGITRITAYTYRRIAPAVSENGLDCGGELIPFDAKNAGRLTAAVEELRSRINPAPEAAPTGRQDHGPHLKEAKRALAAAIEEMKQSSVLPMDTHQRQSFHIALARGAKALQPLAAAVPY
jgi:hypothetical protein